jgi:hypothetical protein
MLVVLGKDDKHALGISWPSWLARTPLLTNQFGHWLLVARDEDFLNLPNTRDITSKDVMIKNFMVPFLQNQPRA